ncbi:MAG: dTDP-4-dehydrorhamnose 3,5-epimerase [Oscillibacter sp.]|nr:dTDP-4-dehydrorhamnose 3,5-epimerase [Oscillibacter sp.]
MGQIQVEKDVGGISGLCVIAPVIYGDKRGYFTETWNKNDLLKVGLDFHFVQDNQSGSVKGVLRGLHFQKHYPQAKLVRVIRGAVFDVAVDIRHGSATWGAWHGELLTEENRHQFLIPRGFAHGFLVLSDRAEFCYKCDNFYHAEDEGGLAWNDPDIRIQWPEVVRVSNGAAGTSGYALSDGTPLLLSEKDSQWRGLRETDIPR